MDSSPRITQKFVESLAWNGTRLFVRDADLKGFMIVVNRSSKSFMVQRDVWTGERGKRRLIGTRRALIGRVGTMSLKEARDKARQEIARMARGEEPNAPRAGGPTLQMALKAFLDWQARKDRRPRTIEFNRYHIEKYLADWLDLSLASIGADQKAVRDRHLSITKSHGPHAANNAMRCLRAVYRFEKRVNPSLPEVPVHSHDFNAETRREKFVTVEELPTWKAKVEAIGNPVRRDLQLFLIFSGLRRTSACEARWQDFDETRRLLQIPSPKGGPRRRFSLPLSSFLIQLLKRRREENAVLYPTNSEWIFPSNSRSGHVTEPKTASLPCPHTLRHSFATAAIACGVPWADLQLLLNHSTPHGVTGGYVHEHGLLDRLAEQMERISDYLVQHINKPVTKEAQPITEPKAALIMVEPRSYQEVTP